MKVATLSLGLLAFLFVFSTQIFAAAFTVNNIADATDITPGDGVCETATGNGVCTFRAAVVEANNLASNDTISFAAGITNIVLSDEIPIQNNGSLDINGPGANVLTIDGGTGTNRIFHTNGATATITGVTLTGGNGTGAVSSGQGGAIFASGGTLVLNGVHVTANSSASAAEGGGVLFVGGANHQILNSTFSANAAGFCGGFFNFQGILTVTNSTVSGNSATNRGGGICSNTAGTTLRSVTITGNSAGILGGGIYQFDGTVNLGNTIVAGNTGGTGPDIGVEGGNSSLISAGYNLIGNNAAIGGPLSSFPAGNPNANQDIVGTTAAPVDPLLGPLANNGGATPTHALLDGSPAIDQGNAVAPPLTTDQRGATRPSDNPMITNAAGGDGSDIGSFEIQAPTAANVQVSGRVITAAGRGIVNAFVTLTDANGVVRMARSSRFGYYRFDDVQTDQMYIVDVRARRFQFPDSPRVIYVNDELTDVDFTAGRVIYLQPD